MSSSTDFEHQSFRRLKSTRIENHQQQKDSQQSIPEIMYKTFNNGQRNLQQQQSDTLPLRSMMVVDPGGSGSVRSEIDSLGTESDQISFCQS